MLALVEKTINSLEENQDLQFQHEIEKAKHILDENDHVLLSRGKGKIALQIENETTETLVEILMEGDEVLIPKINGSHKDWNATSIAALYVIQVDLINEELSEGIKYTREGMIKRVLDERADRARKAEVACF